MRLLEGRGQLPAMEGAVTTAREPTVTVVDRRLDHMGAIVALGPAQMVVEVAGGRAQVRSALERGLYTHLNVDVAILPAENGVRIMQRQFYETGDRAQLRRFVLHLTTSEWQIVLAQLRDAWEGTM